MTEKHNTRCRCGMHVNLRLRSYALRMAERLAEEQQALVAKEAVKEQGVGE